MVRRAPPSSNMICILIGIEIYRNSINFRARGVFSVTDRRGFKSISLLMSFGRRHATRHARGDVYRWYERVDNFEGVSYEEISTERWHFRIKSVAEMKREIHHHSWKDLKEFDWFGRFDRASKWLIQKYKNTNMHNIMLQIWSIWQRTLSTSSRSCSRHFCNYSVILDAAITAQTSQQPISISKSRIAKLSPPSKISSRRPAAL